MRWALAKRSSRPVLRQAWFAAGPACCDGTCVGAQAVAAGTARVASTGHLQRQDTRLAALSLPSTGLSPSGPEQLDSKPFVLVSSHLMRRRDRHKDLLEAEPYDLVVLDEAHHAHTRRGTSSGGDAYAPTP